MEHFFDNVIAAVDQGLVTDEQVNHWLDVMGLEGEAREAKWSAVHSADGSLIKFQIVALHRAAKTADVTRRAAAASVAAAPKDDIVVPDEFLKDVPEPVYENPLPDLAGEIKRRLGIIAAVRMFGKPQAKIKDHRTEGVKVRCPFPSHNDENPSAWVNTEKNTWYCGVCTCGGDVIDFFAARRRGFRPSDFHKSKDFSEVVKEMGEEMGLHVVKRGGAFEIEDDGAVLPSPLPDAPGGEDAVAPAPRSVPVEADFIPPDEPLDAAAYAPEPVVPPSPEAAEPITVTVDDTLRGIAFEDDDVLDTMDDDDDDFKADSSIPSFDYRDLPINPGSFLGEWMKFHTELTPWLPEEYALFVGLQAVGLACGHNVTSETIGKLNGSLLVTLIGHSGTGKSTAVSSLTKMLRDVAGPKFDEDLGTGVKMIASPASSEALIKSIYTEIEDIGHPVPGTKRETGVTAWMYEDEMATFVARASRRGGGTLKTRLMQLHDFTKSKDDPELVLKEFSLTSGYRELHDTFFAALFTTQTEAIRGLMDSTDLVSGFLNRIIPVMGTPRTRRRLADAVALPDDPDHHHSYRALWDRCRSSHKSILFTQEAKEVLDDHPAMLRIERLVARESLYARIPHLTMRLAFLLAVNNNEREVSEKYAAAAVNIMANYLVKCFDALRKAVVANELTDSADKIVAYVRRFYNEKRRWPNQREWSKDRSYGDDINQRGRALDALFSERLLVRVRLQEGKGVSNVFVIPEGEWAGYADSHDKKYNKAEFYGSVE